MSCCKDPKNKDCIVFWIILGIQILALILVCLKIMPRELVLVSSALVLFYIIVSPIEDGLTFFIASVPIFVALPISENFDSLSAGRIFILVLFLKWIFGKRTFILSKIKTLGFKQIFKNYRFELFAIILFLILTLSIINAIDIGVAVKRLIYLINLSVIFIMVKDLTRSKEYLKRIIKAILISFGIVVAIGLLQLISAYFFNIGNFWNYWADNVAYNFYGGNLRDIVRNANAWFAASPTGSSVVRSFGSFTDPHSFALYLLLICPFLYLFVFPIFKGKKISGKDFIFILTLFFIILSGTRGIWFSVVCGIVAAIYLFLRKKDLRHVATYILITLAFFMVLIPIASVFTAIPQFKEKINNTDSVLILKRLTSILDINETSNQGRIYIWKKSIESIKKSPLLGIGIGNFPVALEQDVELAKAGSSAHNLYLNFAVEGGILALIFVILIFLEILFTLLKILKSEISPKIKLLIGGIFIYFIWVFGYGLFDIALLDERVFLLFLTIVGVVYAIKNNPELQKYE
jgi:O-antigen ligase